MNWLKKLLGLESVSRRPKPAYMSDEEWTLTSTNPVTLVDLDVPAPRDHAGDHHGIHHHYDAGMSSHGSSGHHGGHDSPSFGSGFDGGGGGHHH